MAPLFASRVQLTCETCHGKRVGGHYACRTRLPKLGDDLSKFKREDVEWMARDIKPTMARLLGRPEFRRQPDRVWLWRVPYAGAVINNSPHPNRRHYRYRLAWSRSSPCCCART
jgi:hypothetical protein